MRFGIDIDGVVADFGAGFVREINLLWPGRLPIGYQHQSWEWVEVLTKIEYDHVFEVLLGKHNWWLSLPADFQNVRAIANQRVRYPNDEIFYVTARGPTPGMSTMHQTQIWLNQCGIGGLGTAVIVDEDSEKSPIFNALGCDANIDDKLEAVIAHDRETSGAFLLSRPWNKEGRPSSLRAVDSLEKFFHEACNLSSR